MILYICIGKTTFLSRTEIMKRECDFSDIEIKVLQSKDDLLIKPYRCGSDI